MSESSSVGIIGVGLLGSALVDVLASARRVEGYDPGQAQTANVHLLASARDVAERNPIVFLSLPNSQIVRKVLEDISPVLTERHLIVDTTTGDPPDALAHADMLAASGARLVEATIAGSSDLLRKRQAGIFLGGAESDLERVQHLFEELSERCEHVGALGSAARFKLVFNLALGLHRAVLAEALHFGELLGFKEAQTLEILQHSPAQSGVMLTKGQKMIASDYDPPQARVSQHLKDVRLMLAEAERRGEKLPLSATHRDLLESAEALGYGSKDTAAVREAYRSRSEDRP